MHGEHGGAKHAIRRQICVHGGRSALGRFELPSCGGRSSRVRPHTAPTKLCCTVYKGRPGLWLWLSSLPTQHTPHLHTTALVAVRGIFAVVHRDAWLRRTTPHQCLRAYNACSSLASVLNRGWAPAALWRPQEEVWANPDGLASQFWLCSCMRSLHFLSLLLSITICCQHGVSGRCLLQAAVVECGVHLTRWAPTVITLTVRHIQGQMWTSNSPVECQIMQSDYFSSSFIPAYTVIPVQFHAVPTNLSESPRKSDEDKHTMPVVQVSRHNR